ncbi:MAG: alpha/beta fold hydrolase [Hyphomonadaceae bacterium]
MAYADEGVGPAVLLIHGWAAHGGFFQDLRTRLKGQWRVLTPSLRGHPGSQAGDAPLTIETLGQDIAELVEALDLDRVAAIGWSMGAMALWAAAPRLAGRLSALVVEEMSPRVTNAADWPHGIGGAYEDADVAGTLAEIRADWPAYVARFAPRLFARGVSTSLVTWAAEEMAKADNEAMAAFWRSMAMQDFRERLAAIDAPVLVVHGAESAIHPEGATKFVARAASEGKHVVIPGAGHVPHLEAPELFFEHVEAFARFARPDHSRGVRS